MKKDVSLNPKAFFQPNSHNTRSLDLHKYEKIQTAPQITPNAFQKALSIGDTQDGDKKFQVDEERTDYWSDFSRLTYNPSLLLTHPDFNYDVETGEGIGKNISTNKFQSHQLGLDSFHGVEQFRDSVDDGIRKMFEEAHNVSQVNAIVELDSAWSGVCSETLNYVIEDQLDGKGSKVMIWSLQRDGDYVSSCNNNNKLDRIRKLLSLGMGEAGGVVSLNLDYDFPLLKNKTSIWEKTAFLSLPFDFFNSIKDNDITGILHQLTDGGLRRFINEIKLDWSPEIVVDLGCKDIFTSLKTRKGNPHVFSRSVVASMDSNASRVRKFSDFEKLVETGTPRIYLQTSKSRYSYEFVDTLPAALKEAQIDASSLGVTNSLKSDFKEMHDFVSKFCRTDEREELKDNLDNLREAYTFGYELSDEEEDDDY
ncbi:hypothetical protein PMKS-002044 [Pichia membranifaciens]|uniref:DML1/Misato tubulin domain-containing protein n=1 Tax=Pichia membranifaciens TaxID=4926 RepID=A0A1Q2YGQ9_9ASCO|nr:hypothetical protein PMKS-002044 [Pichia membranifaciens]